MSVSVKQCLVRSQELTESETARFDAEILLCEVLQRDRSFLFARPEHVLTAEQAALFEGWWQRRLSGEPVAHILGVWEFWGLRLSVDGSTLIPRPDTEIIVEHCLHLPLPVSADVLDLGTGTGAIALALASEKSAWRILGLDVSPQAVDLARRNCDQLSLANVTVELSDWFAAVEDRRFDLIVSNPPYIAEGDAHLAQGDVRFEPLSALVSGNDGLDDLRFLIQESPTFLTSKGWLVVEHGYDQQSAVQGLFRERGFLSVLTVNDYGGNPRVTLGQKPD